MCLLSFVLQIQICKYTNKKWSFCMRICILGQKQHLIYNTNTQMRHFKVEPLQCNFLPSFAHIFAYLCIVAKKSQPTLNSYEGVGYRIEMDSYKSQILDGVS
jgi:hypothetical protein